MSGEFFARANSEPSGEPDDDASPWAAVQKLFNSAFSRLDAVVARIEALEEKREARNGRDGRDGRGVTGARIEASGDLVFSFSDGTEFNAGA